MNRDEILKKSRAQKEDEGTTFIENRGKTYGIIGLSAMFFMLAVIFIFVGGHNLNVPFSMMCAYQGAENIGKYSANKAKSNLIAGIIMSLTSMGFFMAYLLIDVLKVIVY